jgi:hypothetical protein
MTCFSKTMDTRSSHVEFTLDAPREVIRSARQDGWDDGHDQSVMVVRVIVMCTWSKGGYSLIGGSPGVMLRGDEGELIHLSELESVPEWLSEIIAAGTPTDLWHDAA